MTKATTAPREARPHAATPCHTVLFPAESQMTPPNNVPSLLDPHENGPHGAPVPPTPCTRWGV
eukprot:10100893-Prorocentrum_lima.AAC.1